MFRNVFRHHSCRGVSIFNKIFVFKVEEKEFSFSFIITQIGRENKFFVKIRVSRTVEDAGPYNL